mgnify:CR=1 FL=1
MKTMLSKLTSALLCLAMLLTMCSFAMAEAGTYTGVGDSEIGGKGAIEVSVTVDENGVVTDIQVTKNGDTAGIADAAVEAMPGRIMAAQSANVDGVSGATMTSEAIKMAVLDAVTAAGLDTVKWSTYAATEAAKADDATYNTDIVIVGAGGAGMTAALTAAEKGANVIILESQAAVGGNSVRATGGMNAADTPAQDENEFGESAGVEKTLKTARTTYADNVTITKLAEEVEKQWADYQANPVGYFDSDELMELDTMIGGKGINNPELVEELADESADRSDSMLGTHFYSGFYTTYSGSYSMNDENESSLKLAAKERETVESGNLCIIGTMDNQLLLGRGGYINGFVYLPNGRYVNNSTGFLGILPNAYSNNNQATIVAKNISVKGSNIGNLVFQAFDVSSSAGGAGSDIDIAYIKSDEKKTYTKWTFGGYYYG